MASTSGEIKSAPETSSRDSDSEWEEEQTFLMEVKGVFDTESIKSSLASRKPRIVRIDSESPVIEMGERLFVGKWEEGVGTELIFREHPHNKELTLEGKSDRRLVAQKGSVEDKKEEEEEGSTRKEEKKEGEEETGVDDVVILEEK